MKKFFQAIGMLTLLCFSFFYVEKTSYMVREMDDIMIAIKKTSTKNFNKPVDAIIESDTIIPGVMGKMIDENKSYEAMKRYGRYDETLLEYKEVKPNETLKENYDKYIIGGNPHKKNGQFYFLVDNNTNIDMIIDILKENNVKANFFVDSCWFENNNALALKLIKEGYGIGNLSNGGNYQDSSFAWMDTVIKKIGKQDMRYCYNEKYDKESLTICTLYKNHTIRPNIVIHNQPLISLRKELKAGSIISLPVTKNVIKELPLMISFVKSRGYTITELGEHLRE